MYQLLKRKDVLWCSRRWKATVVDGKAIATKLLYRLKTEVEEFRMESQRVPVLTAVLVGDNAASKLYVKNKMTAANFVGIKTNVLTLPDDIGEQELVKNICRLNEDEEIDAVLLQLPLPAHLNANICEVVSSTKDVDGFTSINFGKFCSGMETFIPCTALAVHKILTEIGIKMIGKNAVVCGRSKHVGLPIAMLLHSGLRHVGCNTSTVICHRHTPPDQLTEFCRNADFIISATGVPSLIRGHMVKEGAVVIDVGISRVIDPISRKSKVIGDVNLEEVSQVAGFITPVPGGVGPLTVAMLMENTLTAARRRQQ